MKTKPLFYYILKSDYVEPKIYRYFDWILQETKTIDLILFKYKLLTFVSPFNKNKKITLISENNSENKSYTLRLDN